MEFQALKKPTIWRALMTWSRLNRNTTSIEKEYMNQKNITSFTLQILCKYLSYTF